MLQRDFMGRNGKEIHISPETFDQRVLYLRRESESYLYEFDEVIVKMEDFGINL